MASASEKKRWLPLEANPDVMNQVYFSSSSRNSKILMPVAVLHLSGVNNLLIILNSQNNGDPISIFSASQNNRRIELVVCRKNQKQEVKEIGFLELSFGFDSVHAGCSSYCGTQ